MIHGCGVLPLAPLAVTLCVLVGGKMNLQCWAPRGENLPELPRGVSAFSCIRLGRILRANLSHGNPS